MGRTLGDGMKVAERILGALLLIAAAVTAYYWWSYFNGGDVRVINERWYTAFESSFPVADGLMALFSALAGIGFLFGRSWAARFGLLAAGTILYLAAMDITFDVENGMYALAAVNDAMKFEIFINVTCVLLGVVMFMLSWRKMNGI